MNTEQSKTESIAESNSTIKSKQITSLPFFKKLMDKVTQKINPSNKSFIGSNIEKI